MEVIHFELGCETAFDIEWRKSNFEIMGAFEAGRSCYHLTHSWDDYYHFGAE